MIGDLLPSDITVSKVRANGGECSSVILDVCSSASIAACLTKTTDVFGGVDILVNNAGLFSDLPIQHFTDISSEAWDKVMAVNVRGTFECAKAAAFQMKKRGGGKIINIASGTATKGTPGLLHYVASKGAVISMTRALARELGDFGISVNALSPGLTMNDNVRQNKAWTPDIIARNVESRVLKREAAPYDIVGALIFLASSSSDFITGQTLSVDGGSVMN